MVSKAVIPVAGFGTRFLPVTKSIPKNMIPVLDHPALHYVVAEAAAAGIRDIVFVVSKNQETVERYFQTNRELEDALDSRGNTSKADEMRAITRMVNVSTVLQEQQLGLGHAVLMARELIGGDPFAVFLPDDIILGEMPTIGSMIEQYRLHGSNVVAVKEVSDSVVPFLGIVDGIPVSESEYVLSGMIEKPSLEAAPSNLAIIGRYVLSPKIFDVLEHVEPGAVGEIQLTDAIKVMMDSPGVRAYRFPGLHFDVGTPAGLLKASINAALQRDEMKDDIVEWMKLAIAEHGD
ncbi:MAG: UTP--glucose-1-phosphate uridylyltransferase [Dehalococcoidia bacterium]|nr:UTP--glucose-1-phosphate uridylyltransferase [Dehalococcoidia bacterium]